jgi:aqualysin 1
VQSGVTFVASAGNWEYDPVTVAYVAHNACDRSPARVGSSTIYPDQNGLNVITVANTDRYDQIAVASNFGGCIDVLAPGVSVATYSAANYATTFSGTSAATPYVSGVAATHLERYAITNAPATIQGAIKDAATRGKITGLYGATPNLLLFNSVPRRRACCVF